MPQICFYFQLHQPYRLADYTVFDISNHSSYFDDAAQLNADIFQKVATKSYLPMLTLLKKLLLEYEDFTCALSCSGVFLEQAEAYAPEVIQLLSELVATQKVELLAETYYHSLAALYSPSEFKQQVYAQMQKVHELFGVTPTVFRNTELVYSNDIAELVSEMRFLGMLTEGVPRYLHGRDKTRVYTDLTSQLLLLLKHAELSDDIAFRFSDRNWNQFPLTVDRYLQWVEIYPEDHVINLFMDFETFGEHQWADTGIFAFFEEFVKRCSNRAWDTFVTPSTIFKNIQGKHNFDSTVPKKSKPEEKLTVAPRCLHCSHTLDHFSYDAQKSVCRYCGTRQVLSKNVLRFLNNGEYFSDVLPHYDVPVPISWADVDRDLTAWIDNPFQKDTISKLYAIESKVLKSDDQVLITDWRRLQTSDHFYYMCTKWSADGDVHAYFSPYRSPYEAYRRYSIVLADLLERVG